MVKLSLLFTFVLATIASTNAGVIRRGGSTKPGSVVLYNATSFCMYMPTKPGGNIGDSESDATVMCTQPGLMPNAQQFPEGFIKTANYNKTENFSQVTGKIDPAAYKLSPSDGGGQYDNQGKGSPPGASCQNAKKFVMLIEPDIPDYCFRACSDASYCNTGESTKGCSTVVPGDYN